MDPAAAAPRSVDQLTTEALPGLPMTDVDRVEASILADCAEAERTIQRLIAQQAASAKTIEALAFQVWSGTQRCVYDRMENRWTCERCREAVHLLELLGFGERMREWAA